MSKVHVAVNSSDGYCYTIGVWDATDFTTDEVKDIIIKMYIKDYGYEPSFGDHGVEIFTNTIHNKA